MDGWLCSLSSFMKPRLRRSRPEVQPFFRGVSVLPRGFGLRQPSTAFPWNVAGAVAGNKKAVMDG
jgi:hypothetical protein